MRKPVLLAAFFALTSLAAGFFSVAAVPVAAQSGSFTIAQNGKPVGTAEFNFAATPRGYDSTSVVHLDMKGLNYSLSKTETLSSANHLRHVQVSAILNNVAVNVTAAPDAAQFLLNVSAGGKSSTARLTLHPGAVFLPDFDPGALETLLALAVTHNNRNLWAIVPKQSTGPDGTVQAGSIASIELATYADEQGTLDSKPITVHHLVANMGGAKTELFSGPENQLLQAELPQPGFALVRNGFVLTPPAKPGAPPVQPAPAAEPAPAPVQQ
jgi:predicted metal-dependent enzyme (double-stranded beta helix superfamily)